MNLKFVSYINQFKKSNVNSEIQVVKYKNSLNFC